MYLYSTNDFRKYIVKITSSNENKAWVRNALMRLFQLWNERWIAPRRLKAPRCESGRAVGRRCAWPRGWRRCWPSARGSRSRRAEEGVPPGPACARLLALMAFAGPAAGMWRCSRLWIGTVVPRKPALWTRINLQFVWRGNCSQA